MNNKNQISAEQLGIDLTKNYSGKEVFELIEIILEESDIAIETSYKEGYKQAIVDTKPDVLYWQNKYKEQKKKGIKNTLIFSSVGLLGGFVAGNITGYKIGVKLEL